MAGAALLLSACGTQGDATPLPETWPQTPLRGFALLNPDEPLALSRAGWDLDQPAAEPAQPGAPALAVWGRMSPRGEPQKGALFRGTIPDSKEQERTVIESLSPTLPWEGQSLGSPAWLSLEDGAQLLFYQGADGSVGIAERGPDGALVKRTAERPLVTAATLAGLPPPGPQAPALPTVGRVSPVLLGARLRLYYSLDSQGAYFAEADLQKVRERLLDPRVEVTFQLGPQVLSAGACSTNPGKRGAPRADRLDGVSVRQVLTPAGRARFDLYAQVSGGGRTALVAASSYSGGGPGDPFLAVDAPLLGGMMGGAGSPSVIERNGRALLLLSLREVQLGVALAQQPGPGDQPDGGTP